ncbi:hypothetical protein COMA1_50024 [Candidatus Nitrospira nitrosa]|uniref:Uncharacterized protein n=1 Tax=Candidatus Nitrospira nitrosa TaxID=1742972 RepID=A0A0S4LL76_9BACT|nr:hypothetical protein COMA1_50024 [Candidatus Nitrospira nitrosa]
MARCKPVPREDQIVRGMYSPLIKFPKAARQNAANVVIKRKKPAPVEDFLLPVNWNLHQKNVSRL